MIRGDVTTYGQAELQAFWQRLMHMVNNEFIRDEYAQPRDQKTWEAGMDTLARLPSK